MNPILKRSIILIISPVWVPVVVFGLGMLAPALLIYTALLQVLAAPVYWVATGEDLMETKYNPLHQYYEHA